MSSRIQSRRLLAFQRQGGRCYYCGATMWLNTKAELPASAANPGAANALRCTAEHLVARSDGGSDSQENIVAACAHCNRTRHLSKKPLQPPEYLRRVSRRVAAGRWHHKWVFEAGLLQRSANRKSQVLA